MLDPTLDPDYYTEVTCRDCLGDGLDGIGFCVDCDGTGVELVARGETEGSEDED